MILVVKKKKIKPIQIGVGVDLALMMKGALDLGQGHDPGQGLEMKENRDQQLQM